MERAVADGALETARKDFARVMREVMALQRNQASLEAHAAAARRQRRLIPITRGMASPGLAPGDCFFAGRIRNRAPAH